MTPPFNTMLVKIVETVTALDSAGKVVEAIPVYDTDAPVEAEQDSAGNWVMPTQVAVDEDSGIPVRVVAGLTDVNGAGQVVGSTLVNFLP